MPALYRRVEAGGYAHALACWGPPPEQARAVVLALHGFGSTGERTFRALGPPAAQQGVCLLAPDLLGAGASDKPERRFSLAYFAEVYAALADRLGLERPLLLGHSMGGKLALACAADTPAHYAACALVSPGGFHRAERLLPPLDAFAGLAPALSRPGLHRRLLGRTPLGPVLAHTDSHAHLGRLWGSFGGLDLDRAGYRRRLAQIPLPMLVVCGGRDGLLGAAALGRIRADLPQARLQVFPEAGHLPHKEHPEAFFALLVGFAREAGLPVGPERPFDR